MSFPIGRLDYLFFTFPFFYLIACKTLATVSVDKLSL